MALWLDVAPGDKVHIGDDMVITVERKTASRKARLRFFGDAPIRLERQKELPAPTNPDGFNPPRVDTGD